MAKKKLYGLIFDSDGTILDSKPSSFKWLKYCITQLYKKPFSYEKYSEQFLKDYNESHKFKGLVGVYEIFGISYEKDKNFLWKHFNEWRTKNPPPIVNGVKEVIFEIYEKSRPKPGKSRGLRMLLNTTNRWSSFEKQIHESGLIKCFDTILTREEIPEIINEKKEKKPYLLKPNNYPIEWALDLLGVEPEEALHVGDTIEDIICCKGLRRKDPNIEKEVKVVAVTWGFETRKKLTAAKPYKIIDNPKQLIKIVEQLGGFD